jgi:hypothetical protein
MLEQRHPSTTRKPWSGTASQPLLRLEAASPGGRVPARRGQSAGKSTAKAVRLAADRSRRRRQRAGGRARAVLRGRRPRPDALDRVGPSAAGLARTGRQDGHAGRGREADLGRTDPHDGHLRGERGARLRGERRVQGAQGGREKRAGLAERAPDARRGLAGRDPLRRKHLVRVGGFLTGVAWTIGAPTSCPARTRASDRTMPRPASPPASRPEFHVGGRCRGGGATVLRYRRRRARHLRRPRRRLPEVRARCGTTGPDAATTWRWRR